MFLNHSYILSDVKAKSESGIDADWKIELIGKYAIPLQFEVGDIGWFVVNYNDDELYPWHRVHTSTVKNIIQTEDTLEIETNNTFYVFSKKLDK